jgi:hypothetical protein
MSLQIYIKAIPHDKHRYETVGDYWEEEDGLQVRVSKMNDWRYEFLVVVHELIEFYLCKKRGIKEPDIKKFDELFEAERVHGLHTDDEEPGSDKRAPYRKEHLFAEQVERTLAVALGVNWKKYSKTVMSL